MFGGYTTGTPIAILVRNKDARPEAYEHLRDVYRPSHADFTYDAKYGFRDWTGGGRASARETVGRVAAAAIARKLLQAAAGIEVLGWVQSVHDIEAAADPGSVTRADVEAGPTRCPDPDAAARMVEAIETARRETATPWAEWWSASAGASPPGWESRCSTSSRRPWPAPCCLCLRPRASR